MAFTIPNNAAALNSIQAELDSGDWDILAAGARGIGVISGCAVSAQGTPDMTVAVAAGLVKIGGTSKVVAAGNVTINAAHASLPRLDLISVDNTGAKVYTAGTAATAPIYPAVPTSGGDFNAVLAVVYVPANDAAINSNQITDKRVLVEGSVVVRKAADETVNNSSTLQNDDHLFFDMGANDVWLVELLAICSSQTSVTPDIKFNFSLPAGATMLHERLGQVWQGVGTSTAPNPLLTGASSSSQGLTNNTTGAIYVFVITNGSTPGTANLQWAQVAATIEDTKVLANSILRARKVA